MLFNLSAYDPMYYLRRLKNAGVDESIAEIHVEETEKVILSMCKNTESKFQDQDFATKGDIRALSEDMNEIKHDIKHLESRMDTKIERSKNQTLLWMFSMLSVFAGFILTVIAKGFKWF